MHIQVASQAQAELANKIKIPHAIISIIQPGRSAKPKENDQTRAKLTLQFHNLESEPDRAWKNFYGEAKLFNEEIAGEVKTFLSSLSDIEMILIHCETGRHRSPALGAALANYYGDGKQENTFFCPPYMPSELVYNVAVKALKE